MIKNWTSVRHEVNKCIGLPTTIMKYIYVYSLIVSHMTTPNSTNDQLSWQDLQQHALWWVRLAADTVSFFWRVLWKHWFLSFSLIGLLTALQVFSLYQQSKSYEMTSTFVYGDLHPKIFGDMIAKVNILINNQEDEQVARLLHLKPSQVSSINAINVSDSRGKSLESNYTMHKEPMIITVKMRQPIPGDSLQLAINHYLNSNPFSAKRLEMKKRLLQEELEFINAKQITIDSVLKRLYETPVSSTTESGAVTIENSEGKNAYELLRFSRELVQRKTDIENSLVQAENVFAIDNFIVLPSARFGLGGIIKSLIIGGILGLFLAAAVVFWREHLSRWIKQLEQQ